MKFDNIIAKRKNKTIYRDGDLCYKVFDSEFSKADVLNEALNQARIEQTSLNVPKIHNVSCIDGRWAIVLDFIEGKTISELLENEKNKEKYLNMFVEIQMKIHAERSTLLNKLHDKMHSKIEIANLDATTKYDLHTRLNSLQKGVSVCHGDFNPTNVIIAKNNKPYIIDWSHVTEGNPSADVARTYLLLHLSDKEGLAKQYLELYCKKADIARQLVQKWLPIVCASQSVKGNESERHFLLSWLDVVDYE